MITQYDLDHHIRRERYHREAALKATDPGVRKSHIEMAQSHARRVQIAEAALKRDKGSARPLASTSATEST